MAARQDSFAALESLGYRLVESKEVGILKKKQKYRESLKDCGKFHFILTFSFSLAAALILMLKVPSRQLFEES